MRKYKILLAFLMGIVIGLLLTDLAKATPLNETIKGHCWPDYSCPTPEPTCPWWNDYCYLPCGPYGICV